MAGRGVDDRHRVLGRWSGMRGEIESEVHELIVNLLYPRSRLSVTCGGIISVQGCGKPEEDIGRRASLAIRSISDMAMLQQLGRIRVPIRV